MSVARGNASSKSVSGPRRAVARAASAACRAEGLERRVMLASAIAAFAAQQTFASGNAPRGVVTADLNRDGQLDLVVSNVSANTVSVMLGNGNGTFAAPQSYAVGTKPYSVAVGDMNGDGRPDVVVANSSNNNVGVLLGNGNGTLAAQATFSTLTGPRSVALADMNGDGRLDVLVAEYGGGAASILLGNGNGALGNQAGVFVGTSPVSIAAGDFNGDGRGDAVVANKGSGNVSVLRGGGGGTFAASATVAAGTTPSAVSVADVNRDGRADILVANFGAGNVGVLLGNGDMTFQAQVTYATGTGPQAAGVADVNGDGRLDLLVPNFSANSVSVLLGNGNGTFAAQKTFGTAAGPYGVAVADVTGDGRLDLLVADSGGNSVGVLKADVPPVVVSVNRSVPAGPTTTATSVTYTVTFNEPVTGVDASDFGYTGTNGLFLTAPFGVSGSGATYTVSANGIVGTGTLSLNVLDDGSIKDAAGNPLQPGGAAQFNAQQTFAAGGDPVFATTADVNSDGSLDLITANLTGSTISILLGNGNGTFKPQLTYDAPFNPFYIKVADMNADGKPDLVFSLINSIRIGVALGNGDGTFQAMRTMLTGPGSFPAVIAVADFNGDGKRDIAVADSALSATAVSVYMGNGDGSFGPQLTFAAGSAIGVTAADVNRDGRVDLLVGEPSTNCVGVLLGNGNGTFAPQVTFATGNRTHNIAVGDLNGDGIPDMAVGNDRDGTVSVLLGNGNGTFGPQTTFGGRGSTGVYDVAIADVNGDGRPDLAVANYKSNNVGVLLGNGDGTFGTEQTFATATIALSVAVADVNRDGRLDVVAANGLGNNVVGVFRAVNTGAFTGQQYIVYSGSDSVTGSTGGDTFTLVQDPDHVHVDWTLGTTTGQIPINDPNGLTLVGNGGGDVITLDYTNGNPLPNTLHLNGTFTINGLAASNPLAGTTLDVGRSAVRISYTDAGSDPLDLIKQYLASGYHGGAWDGTSAAGVITSSDARNNASHNTGVAWVDSAEGSPLNNVANTILLTYAVIGDTDLDGTVGLSDYTAVVRNFGVGTSWTKGVVTYDGTVGLPDYTAVVRNFGQSAPSAVPAASGSVAAAAVSGGSGGTGDLGDALVVVSPDGVTGKGRAVRRDSLSKGRARHRS